MCGPGVEMLELIDDEANERLEKHMGQLKEASRLAQVYYNNEQWPLLEKINQKIIIITNMIRDNLIKNERYIPEDDKIQE